MLEILRLCKVQEVILAMEKVYVFRSRYRRYLRRAKPSISHRRMRQFADGEYRRKPTTPVIAQMLRFTNLGFDAGV